MKELDEYDAWVKRSDRYRKIILVVLITGIIALLTWVVVSMNNWKDNCNDAGGVVESEFLYYQTTYVQSGNTQIPVMTPIYDYHCMRDGVEIEVKD